MELLLHAQELLRLLLGQLVHRDAGPQREHLSDRLLVDLVEEVDTGRLHLGLFGGLLLEDRLLLVAEATGVLEALLLDRESLGAQHIVELALELAEIGRGLHPLDAEP